MYYATVVLYECIVSLVFIIHVCIGPESVDYEEGEVSQQTFEKDDIAHNTSLPPLPPEQLDTVVQVTSKC